MIAWQQPDICSKDGTNSWEDLGRVLEAEKGKLDSLQNLTDHPILDFNLNYGQGFFLPLSHIAPLLETARVLEASVLYNLHRGNVTDGCANLREMLALPNGEIQEPITLSQKVRMVITYLSANATWEILQDTNISESEIAAMQKDWQTLEFVKALERAQLMDRVLFISGMERMRQNPKELWDSVSTETGGDIQKKMGPEPVVLVLVLFR